jgi:hypothetical protein
MRFELCSNEPTLATMRLSRRWGTRSKEARHEAIWQQTEERSGSKPQEAIRRQTDEVTRQESEEVTRQQAERRPGWFGVASWLLVCELLSADCL